MLKNKKAVYILIPLNLLIWGFFIYRFYSAYSNSGIPLSETKENAIKIDLQKDSITYALKLDYKDPFLKETKRERILNSSNFNINPQRQINQNTRPKQFIDTPPKLLPDVKYLGLIKNNNTGLSTALVTVNGQSKLIRPNETIEGLVFKSFNKDSLVAKWGKERIVVNK